MTKISGYKNYHILMTYNMIWKQILFIYELFFKILFDHMCYVFYKKSRYEVLFK